jgi:hypothetical protein
MIDDVSMTWFRLRERRSSLRSRSRVGDSAGRRQTFAAAMQQFEEQFTAAKVVTAYTRPLNLYYGLAQAGMAIAAAQAPDPWSFSRHGLTLTDRSGDLAAMMVRHEGEGGFQKIAAATGSASCQAKSSRRASAWHPTRATTARPRRRSSSTPTCPKAIVTPG